VNNIQNIKRAEGIISKALWNAVSDEDHEKELQEYEKAKEILTGLVEVSPEVEKERNRVLSFCLMRIDNTLVSLGDKKGGPRRMEEALKFAMISEDKVQIARCFAALGARLAGNGLTQKAEENWSKAIAIAEGNTEYDMQQIVGWTLIARARFLKQLGKHMEALEIARLSEGKLRQIENYAGVANANAVMAEIYEILGDQCNKERCKKSSEDYMTKAKTERK
jgi:tetratricopeptide (TPR) repeat protein